MVVKPPWTGATPFAVSASAPVFRARLALMAVMTDLTDRLLNIF
jgi:hypothetical protein